MICALINNHKMLGTDSDGRLGRTVRHLKARGADGPVRAMAGAGRTAMTDSLEGWFAVQFFETVQR